MMYSAQAQTTYVAACDHDGVDIGDGVHEVVSLIYDHHIPLHTETHSVTSGSMQESVVWQHYQLHKNTKWQIIETTASQLIIV